MKTEVLSKKKEFQPIELKITIERADELCDLWNRLNESHVTISRNCADILIFKSNSENRPNEFFDLIDQLTKENNLYK